MRDVKVEFFCAHYGDIGELQEEINDFIKDKELVDIKLSQSQSYGSYSHNTKTTVIVIYRN